MDLHMSDYAGMQFWQYATGHIRRNRGPDLSIGVWKTSQYEMAQPSSCMRIPIGRVLQSGLETTQWYQASNVEGTLRFSSFLNISAPLQPL